uniref:Uncharacterized protein n=1 Tax=Coturnix japonica TaxID=93934 RepID=A0A8C2YFM8_COTJA
MPAGVPWSTYLKTLAASMMAMFAGAEVVHRYYRPDLRRLTLLTSAHLRTKQQFIEER